jgi:hypothetical protein
MGELGDRRMATGFRVTMLIAAASVVALAPQYARAQDQQGFKMPSGNIFCVLEQGSDSSAVDMRCDINQMTDKGLPRPRGCPLSYGDAFVINATGAAIPLCHGDTVANPDLPPLAYGTVWRVNAFTCRSATTGVTCSNASGHGFILSREAQKLF